MIDLKMIKVNFKAKIISKTELMKLGIGMSAPIYDSAEKWVDFIGVEYNDEYFKHSDEPPVDMIVLHTETGSTIPYFVISEVEDGYDEYFV